MSELPTDAERAQWEREHKLTQAQLGNDYQALVRLADRLSVHLARPGDPDPALGYHAGPIVGHLLDAAQALLDYDLPVGLAGDRSEELNAIATRIGYDMGAGEMTWGRTEQ